MFPNKKKYLAFVTYGHTGRTIISLILNSHSQITVLGEFETFRKRLSHGIGPFCQTHGEECDALDVAERKTIEWIYSGGSLFSRLKRFVFHLYYVRRLRQKTGSTVICDTSKTINWAKSLLSKYDSFLDVRFLVLCRDGRAVVNSFCRFGHDPVELAINWRRHVRELDQFLSQLPAEKYIKVKYEEFAADSEKIMRQICDFLEIPFEPEMLEYKNHIHHIVGGNDAVFHSVDSSRKLDSEELMSNYREFYEDLDGGIMLDERWKTDLSKEDLLVVERIEKDALRSLGYPLTNRDSQ